MYWLLFIVKYDDCYVIFIICSGLFDGIVDLGCCFVSGSFEVFYSIFFLVSVLEGIFILLLEVIWGGCFFRCIMYISVDLCGCFFCLVLCGLYGDEFVIGLFGWVIYLNYYGGVLWLWFYVCCGSWWNYCFLWCGRELGVVCFIGVLCWDFWLVLMLCVVF